MDVIRTAPHDTSVGNHTIGEIIQDVEGGGSVRMWKSLRKTVGGSLDDAAIPLAISAGIIAMTLFVLASRRANSPTHIFNHAALVRAAGSTVPGYEKFPGMVTTFDKGQIDAFQPDRFTGEKIRPVESVFEPVSFVGYPLTGHQLYMHSDKWKFAITNEESAEFFTAQKGGYWKKFYNVLVAAQRDGLLPKSLSDKGSFVFVVTKDKKEKMLIDSATLKNASADSMMTVADVDQFIKDLIEKSADISRELYASTGHTQGVDLVNKQKQEVILGLHSDGMSSRSAVGGAAVQLGCMCVVVVLIMLCVVAVWHLSKQIHASNLNRSPTI